MARAFTGDDTGCPSSRKLEERQGPIAEDLTFLVERLRSMRSHQRFLSAEVMGFWPDFLKITVEVG